MAKVVIGVIVIFMFLIGTSCTVTVSTNSALREAEKANDLQTNSVDADKSICILVDQIEDRSAFKIVRLSKLDDERFGLDVELAGEASEAYLNLSLYDKNGDSLGGWSVRGNNQNDTFHLVIETEVPQKDVTTCKFDLYSPK